MTVDAEVSAWCLAVARPFGSFRLVADSGEGRGACLRH